MKEERENETSQFYPFWPALCALVMGAGASIFCATVWGRTQKVQTLAVTLLLATVGIVLGIFLRKTKKQRLISILVSIFLFASCISLSRFLTSDFYVSRREWKEYTLGDMSFLYPSLEWKKSTEGIELSNGRVSMYTNENMKRYVCAFVYDFTGSHPDLPDTTEGAINGMLQSFKAELTGWSNVQAEDDFLKTRFTYTRGDKEFTGVAGASQDEGHYEIVMFFPLKKQYSEDFMQKLEEGILPKSTE